MVSVGLRLRDATSAAFASRLGLKLCDDGGEVKANPCNPNRGNAPRRNRSLYRPRGAFQLCGEFGFGEVAHKK